MDETLTEQAQAWLLDGPAIGAFRLVDLDLAGKPPPVLVWHTTEVYVGAGDEPAPAALVSYELVADRAHGLPIMYRYAGTLDL